MPDIAAPGTASTPDDDPNDHIEISLPLRAEFGSTLRLLVSSLGADAGFSVDEIDDLRLAVSEIFTVLTEAVVDKSNRLTASFAQSDDGVTVSISAEATTAPLELDPLAQSILASVVDSHEIHPRGVTLHKRGIESAQHSA